MGAFMAEKIDDITINFQENGIDTIKELDKAILTRGAWTTILFRYQEWDAKNNNYGPDKYSIRRYQKRNDSFWQKSKFNISNKEQAKKIIENLQKWID